MNEDNGWGNSWSDWAPYMAQGTNQLLGYLFGSHNVGQAAQQYSYQPSPYNQVPQGSPYGGYVIGGQGTIQTSGFGIGTLILVGLVLWALGVFRKKRN